MTPENQVEEMAKVMHERCREISEDTEGIAKLEAQGKTMPDDFAEVLYNAGYRKATDVAREIFEEIDNALHHMAVEYHNAGHPEYFAVCEMVYHKVLRRIEKKYTEVEENE